jgi:hypothetical protein
MHNNIMAGKLEGKLLCSRRYCPANIHKIVIPLNYSAISSQPPLQNSTELIAASVLVTTSRHGPHRKHHFSIVAFVSVAAGTCLPSHFAETGCVTLFIKNLLPSHRALFRDRYPATGPHATLYFQHMM